MIHPVLVQLPLSSRHRSLKANFVREMLFTKTARSGTAIRICNVSNGPLKQILKIGAVIGQFGTR